VTYQDTSEMLLALDVIQNELNSAGKPKRSRVFRLYQRGNGL
jgi:hypothetical protein